MIAILRYRAVGSSVIGLLCGLSCPAADSDQKKTRPLDNYRALFVICVKSFNTTWTAEACDYLKSEARRRGEQDKLLVSKDNEREPDEFRNAHGLKVDEVLWLVMKFEESDKEKGRLSLP